MKLLFVCFLLLFVIEAVWATTRKIKMIKNRDTAPRGKRQLYLCGTQPYQYYSTSACPSSQSCPNGGIFMNVACTGAYQCTPYYSGTSTCINGFCCTVPTTNNNLPSTVTQDNFGICPSGQLSEVRCTSKSQCSTGQTCVSGLCCTTTGNEWNIACGGQTSLSACDSSGRCSTPTSVCTSSNYCCECAYGQAYGTCGNGVCPTGFSCQANGNCCPTCPNNQVPFGSCVSGVCGGGRTCQNGNICC